MGQKQHMMTRTDGVFLTGGRWLVAMLACSLFVAGPAVQAQQLSPTIKIDEPDFAFEEVWAGTKIEHTWTVHNNGKTILRITRVKPSCGCTVSRNYDREILPGETGKIPISIDTTRLRAKVKKSVTVESNDPANAQLRLTITGTVKQRVKIDPVRGGTFGRIKPNESVKRTLTLTNNTGSPVELSLMSSTAGVFAVELVEKKPGEVYELKLTTKPPYKDKYNKGQIKLKTNIAEQPVVEIAASVYVLPEVEVTPPNIIIPKAQERARKQPVRVTFNTDESHKVLSAKVDDPDINVDVFENRNNSYTISLRFPPNYLPPGDGHKLTIKTDHPKNEEITVKIASRRAAAQRPKKPAMALLGKPVPEATFVTEDGKNITTKNPDEVSFYIFYASWCGYCKKALPKIDEMAKEYGNKGARFLAVSLDTLVEDGADPKKNKRARTKDQVVGQWDDLGISFTQAFDPDKAGSKKFKVQGFPTMFVVGKDGNVERVYSGITAVKDGSLKQDISDLLAGKKLKPQKVDMVAQTRPKKPVQELVGKPAPAATFVTADGKAFSTKNPDEVSFYFFYASWCGYCKKGLPKINDMTKEFADKGVRFLGVNQDTILKEGDDPTKNRRARTKESCVKQWSDLGLTFTQVFDPDKAGSAKYKVRSFPTMVLVDKAGTVQRVYSGIGSINNGSLKKDIATLAAGKKLKAQAVKPVASRRRPAQELEGKPAPAATFVTTSGESYNAVENGQVSFTMFYTSWCGYCKKALPKIDALAKEYGDKPVRFVAVSQDTLVEDGVDPQKNRRAKTKDYVVNQFKTMGISSIQQAFDPAKAGKSKYKATSFPTMFLTDKTGKIAKVYVGGTAANDGSLKRDIDALLAK